MKQYWSFFRIRFTAGLQYRAAALAGIATQLAFGSMMLLRFFAFYRTNPEAAPMEFSQLASYIWLQQAFFTLFSTWSYDSEVFSAITSGSIAYEMVRPVNLYAQWFVKNVAKRMSMALPRCIPVLAVSLLLPRPYRLSLPDSPGAFCAFFVTGVLGMLVATAYTMLVYGFTFFTLSPQGLRLMMVSITDLFTGALIPLPFLPDSIRWAMERMPFAMVSNLPLRAYSGHISGGELMEFFLWQVFWLAALVGVGLAIFRKAQKKVVVQGG
jgi:ABC-2 type transport system permease protein